MAFVHQVGCACRWRGANNGEVRRSSDSKVKKGLNCQFCGMDHLVLGVLRVLQIFSGYARLHMCSRQPLGCAYVQWAGANNGKVGITSNCKA